VHNDATPFYHAAILDLKATAPVVASQALFAGGQSAEGDAEAGDGNDYSSRSKEDLQTELETRGLPTSGNKADLIERLTADDEG
jgi:hypothetical protein